MRRRDRRRSRPIADDPPSPAHVPWRGGCGPGSITTAIEDGRRVCIRRVDRADEALMRAGIERMSPHSRYLRFFSGMRTPPDWVIDRLLDADGVMHLAWGALDLSEDPPRSAIGAVHAFRDEEDPECAEFSVAIIDDFHGLGLGKLLTATILLDAREEGITRFHVETLSENRSATQFTRMLGGVGSGTVDASRGFVVEIDEALTRLRQQADPPGIAHVFAAFDG